MRRFPRELLLALALALIHGLLWVFVTPPWEHYDEPSHLEYAWLIANKGKLPSSADVDHDMRIAFTRSMIRAGFYRDRSSPPDVDDPNAPTPSIGYSQLEDSPWYYLAPAAPLFFLQGQSIETQLYAARIASSLFFLITVACSWGVAAALTRPGHPLRWMLPCAIALLPAFADLMTAVNSDAGAVAAFSLFVWGSVRLLNPRHQPRRAWQVVVEIAWVTLAAVLCVLIKGTSAPALPLAGVALLFGVLRGRWRTLAWLLFALIGAATLTALFEVGDAALWYRNSLVAQREPTRCGARACDPPPVGSNAIRIVAVPGAPPPYLFQSIPPAAVAKMRGQTVTVGAWMWAHREAETNSSEPLTVETTLPIVNYNYTEFLRKPVTLDTTPRFVAMTGTISVHAGYARIILPSVSQAPDVTTTVMLDGIVLAVGEHPLDASPRFENGWAEHGEWGRTAQPFENLVRNASGEGTWITLRPQVAQFIERFTPPWVSWKLGIAALLDPIGAGWYHRLTAEHMFQTFWARFSWGNVPLTDGWYVALLIVTVASLICTLVALWQRRREVDWSVAVFMALSAIAIWAPAIMRGITIGLESGLWLAGARYAYPAIIPTMLALTFGWSTVMDKAAVGRPDAARGVAAMKIALATFAFMLVTASLVSVIQFYAARAQG